MTANEARQLKEKHHTVKAAARAAGMRQSAFSKLLNGEVKAKTTPSARTLSDFRREHDQTWKIRDGLKRLFGGQVIMTDAEFRDAVSGNPSRWRAAADQTEFRENRYRVGGDLLWASKETIIEMRKIKGEAI